MRRSLPRSLRDAVLRRAQRRCEYCLSPLVLSPDPFAIDHIRPLALGGADTLDNLALSCIGCNGPKGVAVMAIDPESGESAPLYHPRQDRWTDHFAWSSDFTELIGRTATGRVTIKRLNLNRPGVSNLRRLMLNSDEDHPPAWTQRTIDPT